MDGQLTTWPSPAKLNLFLHITGRRDNGYHDLQSVFQMLDVGDTLQIITDDSGKIDIESNVKDIPLEENIIYKAGKLL